MLLQAPAECYMYICVFLLSFKKKSAYIHSFQGQVQSNATNNNKAHERPAWSKNKPPTTAAVAVVAMAAMGGMAGMAAGGKKKLQLQQQQKENLIGVEKIAVSSKLSQKFNRPPASAVTVAGMTKANCKPGGSGNAKKEDTRLQESKRKPFAVAHPNSITATCNQNSNDAKPSVLSTTICSARCFQQSTPIAVGHGMEKTPSRRRVAGPRGNLECGAVSTITTTSPSGSTSSSSKNGPAVSSSSAVALPYFSFSSIEDMSPLLCQGKEKENEKGREGQEKEDKKSSSDVATASKSSATPTSHKRVRLPTPNKVRGVLGATVRTYV